MKLLYKELFLAAHPTLYIFTLCGCLVILPAYPYSVIFMFGCLAPFISFMFARENNGAWFTAVLPVTKSEIVKSKCTLIASAQITQLTISALFSFLRSRFNMANNPVGMDATIAWFGFGFITPAVFDLVFLAVFYKSGYKAGKAFMLGMIPVSILMLITEGIVHIPSLSWLDSSSPADCLRQLPILLTGVACYAAGMWLACRIAAKRFDKADL